MAHPQDPREPSPANVQATYRCWMHHTNLRVENQSFSFLTNPNLISAKSLPLQHDSNHQSRRRKQPMKLSNESKTNCWIHGFALWYKTYFQSLFSFRQSNMKQYVSICHNSLTYVLKQWELHHLLRARFFSTDTKSLPSSSNSDDMMNLSSPWKRIKPCQDEKLQMSRTLSPDDLNFPKIGDTSDNSTFYCFSLTTKDSNRKNSWLRLGFPSSQFRNKPLSGHVTIISKKSFLFGSKSTVTAAWHGICHGFCKQLGPVGPVPSEGMLS